MSEVYIFRNNEFKTHFRKGVNLHSVFGSFNTGIAQSLEYLEYTGFSKIMISGLEKT